MLTDESSHEENIPIKTDACYEALAIQEEIYLEQTEEDLRMILESDDFLQLQDKRPNLQQEHAAEELILGDPDDPPLSDESVEEVLRTIHKYLIERR